MAKQNKSNKTPKSDTRNVVSTEASGSVDFEDQLASIWDENKKLITYGILGIFLIFAVYNIGKFIVARGEFAIQEGYTAAETSEEKNEWAESESGHPLSGFAFKQLADEAYKAGDFEKAAELYANAAKSAKSAIKDAANLGLAMCHLQDGETDEAREIFEKLAEDEASTNQLEAMYQLANLAKTDGDFAQAREYVERIQQNASQETFYWIQKAIILQNELPPEEEAAAENTAG